MQSTLTSYKAPRIAPEKVRLLNALIVRGSGWCTPFGHGQATWELITTPQAFPSTCEATILVAAHEWTVRFSDEGFLLRHPSFASAASSFEVHELPVEVRSAVLRALLTELADTLQKELRVPVAISSIRVVSAVAEPSPLGLCLKAGLSGSAGLPDQSLFLSLVPHSAEATAALADAIRALPHSATPNVTGLESLPLELAFESGYLFLNRTDAAALASGDVLIPDAWYLSENRTLLRLCRGGTPPLTAPCSFADGNAVLESPLSSEVEPDMASEHDDIDIRLSFELDRTTITLGELSSLAPGYVFPLGCDAQTPVTIRANGKSIARGRLVDMDGTLGVQISETL